MGLKLSEMKQFYGGCYDRRPNSTQQTQVPGLSEGELLGDLNSIGLGLSDEETEIAKELVQEFRDTRSLIEER